MTITRQDYAAMEPEKAVDELFAMVHLLAGNIASKALREAHSSYTIPDLIAETDKWIDAAQDAHRLSMGDPHGLATARDKIAKDR